MPVIQLNSELQRSVHAAKRAELRNQAESSMVAQSLSAQESAALVKTFTVTMDARTKDAEVRSLYWW